MVIRNRITELRHIKASDLIPNPKNWRRHPTAQSNALKGALADIGYADALIAYEVNGELVLIDGHLRAETTPDMEVPVLITDLNEEEASKLLATLDPLAAMAMTDQDTLTQLLSTIDIQSDALNVMLESVLEGESEPLHPVGVTPDLDTLSEQYGELVPEAFWTEIRLRVPPKIKEKFDQWLSTGKGITEVEQLEDLLG